MRSTPSRTERWIASRWASVLPVLAILVLWWPSLDAGFQFDDWNVIVNEPRVHSLAGSEAGFLFDFLFNGMRR